MPKIQETITAKQLFERHAGDFNFELNEQELVKEALKRKFIIIAQFPIVVGNINVPAKYVYNTKYKSVTAEDINVRDNGTDASEMVQDLIDEELYGNG